MPNTNPALTATINAAIAYSAETGAPATIRVTALDHDKFAAAHVALKSAAAGGSALREGGEIFNGQDKQGRCWTVRLVFAAAKAVA